MTDAPEPQAHYPMDDPQKRGRPARAATPRIPGKRGTTTADRKKLPICGATNRQGKPCQNPAGKATSHPGWGRCKHHGGRSQTVPPHDSCT